MEIVNVNSVEEKVEKAKNLIMSSGNKLFSVWFVKRSTGKNRRMVCRRRVMSPSYAKTPKGKNNNKEINEKHSLITLFDCNSLRYNKKGKLNGRGNWKSVPLDSITRIKVNGKIYKFLL
jgi:hypothetical protein